MLSHVIRECEEIRGFKVHDTDMLATQYADDSTLFLNWDLNSLNYAVRILKMVRKNLWSGN